MCKRAFKEKAIDLAMDLIQEGKKEGFTYDDIADYVGGAKSTVKGYAYGEKIPSLSVFIGMLQLVKSKNICQRLAKLCNCIVIDISSHAEIKNSKDIIYHTSSITKETSDVLQEIAKSLEDGEITEFEKEKIVKEIDEAIEALLACKISLGGKQ